MVCALVDCQNSATVLQLGASAFAAFIVQVIEPIPGTAAAGSAIVNSEPIHPGMAVPAMKVVRSATHRLVVLLSGGINEKEDDCEAASPS